MRYLIPLGCVLLVLVPCGAKVHGLSVIEQTDSAVTIGSEAFSVQVQNSGRIEAVKAGDTEYVSFIALYTQPSAFRSDDNVRAVQGEGEGRNLGPVEAPISVEKRGERYLLHLHRTAAREEIRNGQPLYTLDETIEISPQGVLNISYHFHFLRICAIGGPTVYVALNSQTFDGQSYTAIHRNYGVHGTFSAAEGVREYPGIEGDMRSLWADFPSGQLALWTSGAERISSVRWGDRYMSVGMRVGRGLWYPGTEKTLHFTLKIPLP
ncbi:MAG: hypothetical protein R6V19_10080 [Armatimonadota bacterium]